MARGGRRAAAAAAVAAAGLGLLGSARACWFWQTDWSTACECERPCWCLVPDEVITPGSYQGGLDDYYMCDNCPCRTEGLFNPGDGPVLGDPGWPFPGQEDTSEAVASPPVVEEDDTATALNETSDAIEDIITEEDVEEVVQETVNDVFTEFLMAWESPIFS